MEPEQSWGKGNAVSRDLIAQTACFCPVLSFVRNHSILDRPKISVKLLGKQTTCPPARSRRRPGNRLKSSRLSIGSHSGKPALSQFRAPPVAVTAFGRYNPNEPDRHFLNGRRHFFNNGNPSGKAWHYGEESAENLGTVPRGNGSAGESGA